MPLHRKPGFIQINLSRHFLRTPGKNVRGEGRQRCRDETGYAGEKTLGKKESRERLEDLIFSVREVNA